MLGGHLRSCDDNIKMELNGKGLKLWMGFIWLRIGSSFGLLCIWWWTLEIHKRRGRPWLAERTKPSQEGLCLLIGVKWAEVSCLCVPWERAMALQLLLSFGDAQDKTGSIGSFHASLRKPETGHMSATISQNERESCRAAGWLPCRR
jgi:hypothetical protein